MRIIKCQSNGLCSSFLMRSVILPEPREGEELAETLASLQSVRRLNGVLCNCSYYLEVELEVPLDESILFCRFFRQPTVTQTAFFFFFCSSCCGVSTMRHPVRSSAVTLSLSAIGWNSLSSLVGCGAGGGVILK